MRYSINGIYVLLNIKVRKEYGIDESNLGKC